MSETLPNEFVRHTVESPTDLGIDRSQPRIVEVVQLWNGTLMEMRHLELEDNRVQLGDTPRQRRPLGSYAGLAPLAVGCGYGAAVGSAAAATVGAGLSLLGLSAGMLHDETKRVSRQPGFFVPEDHLPSDDYSLVRRYGGVVHVQFTDDFRGYFEDADGQRTPLSQLIASHQAIPGEEGYACELPEEGRFIIQIDEMTFVVRMVHQAKRVIPGLTHGFDFMFLGMFALIAFGGLVLGVAIHSMPYDPTYDVVNIPDRFADVVYVEPQPEPPKKKLVGNDPDAGEGAKAKGKEGRVGDERSKLRHAKGTRRAQRDATRNKSIAEKSGLLRDLNAMEADNNLFGDGGLSNGLSANMGGIIGVQGGNQWGNGGLGSRGSGLGGNGTGEFIGGGGTRGRGTGGSGWGKERGYHGVKTDGVPNVTSGDVILLGGLRKDQIDRVVKKHLSQIRYCYQKELNRNPTMAGKVQVRFVIDKDGHVSNAKIQGTSLNSPVVENCICERFMHFKFPKPTGGGIVIVTYPFVFNVH